MSDRARPGLFRRLRWIGLLAVPFAIWLAASLLNARPHEPASREKRPRRCLSNGVGYSEGALVRRANGVERCRNGTWEPAPEP
jgi:hypothetical protein